MLLTIDYEKSLSKLARDLLHLPGDFTRARISALKSCGFWIRGELRNHVEYGGAGWPSLHPMSKSFRKKYKLGNKWFGRGRGDHQTPLFWLGKFARYRADQDKVQIDFGKSAAGKPGTFDPTLIGIVRRAEEGEAIRVTEKMRLFFALTRRKRPKKQTPGLTYFPLKKSTKTLDIPARPMIEPVWKKTVGLIPVRFEAKFFSALKRYEKKRRGI